MSRPNFTVDALDGMSVAALAELPAEMLGELQREVGEALALAKRRAARLNDVLDAKYRERAAAARRAEGKDFGISRIADGEITIEADAKKAVYWDQSGLRGLAKYIEGSGDNPDNYIITKTELTVSERAFNGWQANIQAAFRRHRTVKPGGTSYKVLIAPKEQES